MHVKYLVKYQNNIKKYQNKFNEIYREKYLFKNDCDYPSIFFASKFLDGN